MNLSKTLVSLRACENARVWASKYETLEEAWAACERGDWMLWLWGKHAGPPMSDRRRPLALCAAEIARHALSIFEGQYPTDRRVRECLDTVERWGRGEAVSLEEMHKARAGAAGAAGAAAAAAEAAAEAAAAGAAGGAAGAAAAAAEAAAEAAAAGAAGAGAAAARSESLKRLADIVRKHMPAPTFMGSGEKVGETA